MKLDFIASGTRDAPMLRLFNYTPDELVLLHQAARNLADGRIAALALHEQPWIEAIDGCRFVWCSHERDAGVRLPAPGDEFELCYSNEAWRELYGRIEPFLSAKCIGYNWLTNEGEVRVLLSADGSW